MFFQRYKYQLFVDDKTIYQLLANFKNKPISWIFLCKKFILLLSNLPSINPCSSKGTSTNWLWITKPYTNCWQTSRISLYLEFFYVRNSFYYFQFCNTLDLISKKSTSTNCLWMTKPYTNCWQTSRISLNVEFFYVRNSYDYFLICPTFTPVLPKVQVPIVCGWQNHIPTVGKLQE